MRISKAFTLIELLIVVAIIAILAAIAVPNFIEAQTRSKVSRAKADMRSIITAVEAYRVDANRLPPPRFYSGANGPQQDLQSPSWWGFVPSRLTTPVAYMASVPTMPFIDKAILSFWYPSMSNSVQLPYTYVFWTGDVSNLPDLNTFWTASAAANTPLAAIPYNANDARDYARSLARCSYVLYCAGPDGLDSTVYQMPMTYDPTNGTTSFGDVHAFGAGSSSDSGVH